MAESPEIYQLSKEMNEILKGKICKKVHIRQEKCTNLPLFEINKRILGAGIQNVHSKGKWLIIHLDNGENILISLGVGGDMLYFEPTESGEKEYQVKLMFTDKSGFTLKFRWFGKFYISRDDELVVEKHLKDIAIHPFDQGLTYDYFHKFFENENKGYPANEKNRS